MKKLLSLLGLLLLCGIFCSCSSSDDEETEKKLGYYVANGKVYLAVPSLEKTIYIKIYRKDSKGDIYNVGQIRPTLLNTMISYTFEDELVANKKYQYMAMYLQYTGYEITGWTDEILVYGSPFDNEPVPIVEDSIYLDFDSQTLKLKLKNGNICFPDKTENEDEPEDILDDEDSQSDADVDDSNEEDDSDDEDLSFFKNYVLTLGFTDGSDSALVKLNEAHKVYEVDEYLTLDSVLPAGFMGKSLNVIGVVYEKIIRYPENVQDASLQYKTVYWSTPAKINVKSENKPVNSIVVSKTSSEESEFNFDAPITNLN